MSSIPLPALGIKQQEQPDMLGNLARAMQLKNMVQMAPIQKQLATAQVTEAEQQNQIRAQQLKDQQAMTAAMQQWDGKDYNGLTGLMVKNGASANAVMGLKKMAIEQQQSLAGLTTAQLAAEKQKNDFLAQLVDNVKGLPPEQQAQGFEQAKATAVQRGYLKPEEAQGMQYQSPEQLDLLEKSLLGHAGAIESASKQQQIATSKAQELSAQSTAAKNQMEVAQGGPFNDTTRFINDYLKTNNLPNTAENRLKAQREYIKESKIDPALARTQVWLQMPQEVADPNNPGETINVTRAQSVGMKGKGSASVQTAKAEQKYMTSGKGGQQITAYNTALLHLDTLDRLAGDLNNTDIRIVNRAKQEWAAQTGNPAPANFAAAVNAMSGEVASALKASGATDQEIEKAASTFNRAQSPQQLKGAINTYRELLKGKASQLQRQFETGMQGKPAFDGNSGSVNSDPFAQFGGKAH